MSDDYRRIEIITGTERRRRWSAAEKLRIVEKTLAGGDSVAGRVDEWDIPVAQRVGNRADMLAPEVDVENRQIDSMTV